MLLELKEKKSLTPVSELKCIPWQKIISLVLLLALELVNVILFGSRVFGSPAVKGDAGRQETQRHCMGRGFKRVTGKSSRRVGCAPNHFSPVWLDYRQWGLPWWRSGWESACWCGGHGFKPWSGKVPHAAEQLGPWATTTEPARLEPVPAMGGAAIVKGPRTAMKSERSPHRDEEWPPLAATRESPRTNRRPNTAINK